MRWFDHNYIAFYFIVRRMLLCYTPSQSSFAKATDGEKALVVQTVLRQNFGG